MRRRRAETTKPGQARLDATAQAVIDCAPDPIIALGKDRAVCLWNRAAEEMFGWTAAEVIGLEPPIIPRELRAEHNAVLERVANGSQVSLATRRICRAGEVVDVRIDTSDLVDAAGERLGWIIVCHKSDEDATVRHYMAERARLVRRLGDVVADMNAELDLEPVLDRIAASLRELTRADAGGFVLIEGDRLRLVSMDGLPETLRGRTADLPSSLVGDLLRSGNSVLMRTGETGEFDDLIWSALPGLHTITVSLSHVAGKPYGALYALYSRRQVGHVELELLELLAGHASVALSNATSFSEVVRQRAHERAVIDGSADGIAVLDGEGMVRQWNRAAHALTGVSAAQATGKPPPFPLPDPGATLTYRLPNSRWMEVLCTDLDGRDERVIDFRDVTAAKELEAAKDLFLATTSHELRTPITVVQGFASTLANRWDKLLDTDRRGAVQTIAERAESLGKLVDQLLLGSRAGANRLTVTDEPFDLARVLQDAANVFRPLSDKHVVVADVPADLPRAHGDAAATDSIVGQLLENAFKYSPDGGTITISARVAAGGGGAGGSAARRAEAGAGAGVGAGAGAEAGAGDGQLVVAVQDEGIGIASADLERVFERFVQGEAGDRRRFGGIGLGLYIVRQLARAQGGDVIAARREGGGTAMILTLRQAVGVLASSEVSGADGDDAGVAGRAGVGSAGAAGVGAAGVGADRGGADRGGADRGGAVGEGCANAERQRGLNGGSPHAADGGAPGVNGAQALGASSANGIHATAAQANGIQPDDPGLGHNNASGFGGGAAADQAGPGRAGGRAEPVDAVTGETAPGEAVADQAAADDAVAEDTAADDTLPDDTLSDDTLSDDTLSDDTMPDDTMPDDTRAGGSALGKVASRERAREDVAPGSDACGQAGPGSGKAGSEEAGSGKAGSEEPGSGKPGSGKAGAGKARGKESGAADAGSDKAGSTPDEPVGRRSAGRTWPGSSRLSRPILPWSSLPKALLPHPRQPADDVDSTNPD